MKNGTDRRIILISGVLISFLIVIFVPGMAFFSALDNRYYDFVQNLLKDSGTLLPVIVDIDEKSLKIAGQWPWPRYRVAEIIEKLNNAGASGVALDIIFAEPDKSSLVEIKQDLFNSFGQNLNLADIPEEYQNNDTTLAAKLSTGKTILSYKLNSSGVEAGSNYLHTIDVININRTGIINGEFSPFSGKNVTGPIKLLAESSTHSGFVNIAPDRDGVIRRIPLLMSYQGRIYPGLALSFFMQVVGTGQLFVEESLSNIKVKLGDTQVPVDEKGLLLIRYYGKNKFRYISAIDILDNTYDETLIKGRPVFIGTTSAGLTDNHTTPIDTLFPGVEIHATVLQNLLQKDFLSRPLWAGSAEFIIALFAGIFSSVILSRKNFWKNFSLLAAVIVVLWSGCLYSALKINLYFSPVSPICLIALNMFFLSLIRYRITEKRDARNIKAIEQIENELNVARNIQLGFLPSDNSNVSGYEEFDIFADLIPARQVGGDLYDFFFIDDDHLCFTVGDVSDKGVPAALFMVITKVLIKNSSAPGISPVEMIKKVNRSLCIDNPGAMFVTLIIGVLNIHTGQIKYSNGGHNPPILLRQGDVIECSNEKYDPIIGFSADIEYRELSIDLKANDTLLLYTDGITEAENENNVFFSIKRLIKTCSELSHAPVRDIVSGVIGAVKSFSANVPQSDDIAMLGIRYRGNQKNEL